MITLNGQSAVYFDVDATLVQFRATEDEIRKHGIPFVYPNGVTHILVPHKEHIEQLKEHHSRLTSVIVWSSAGGAWAELVVKTLGLELYVDVCTIKPTWVFDDLPIEKFMPKSRWLPTDNFAIKPYDP